MIEKQDIAKVSEEFDQLWEKRRYAGAVKTYMGGGRPFWHSATVSEYLAKKGQTKQAEKEFKYLLGIYRKIKVMPSPAELLQMIKVYSKKKKEKNKIRRYTNIYLRSCDHYGVEPAVSN